MLGVMIVSIIVSECYILVQLNTANISKLVAIVGYISS